MTCPNCGAPMCLEDGRECLTCDYCKGVYFPEKNDDGIRVLDEPSEFTCPVCAVALARAILEAHPVHYCTRCRGSLIAAPVFVRALQQLRGHRPDVAANPHPPDPRELKRRIQCPQCHRAMDTHYYAGPGNVVIDDCPRCDLNWMDAGELMVIVRAPDHACGYGNGSIWENSADLKLPE